MVPPLLGEGYAQLRDQEDASPALTLGCAQLRDQEAACPRQAGRIFGIVGVDEVQEVPEEGRPEGEAGAV